MTVSVDKFASLIDALRTAPTAPGGRKISIYLRESSLTVLLVGNRCKSGGGRIGERSAERGTSGFNVRNSVNLHRRRFLDAIPSSEMRKSSIFYKHSPLIKNLVTRENPGQLVSNTWHPYSEHLLHHYFFPLYPSSWTCTWIKGMWFAWLP